MSKKVKKMEKKTEISRNRSFTLLENLDEFGRNGGQSHIRGNGFI